MNNNKNRIWLPRKIYVDIIEEAEIWKPYETGGAFMGYIANNNDVVINNMIYAGEKAIHKYSMFEPDQKHQLREIGRIYQESKKNIIYLGDWHTHPNGASILSPKDIKTLIRTGETVETQNANPIMSILSFNSNGWSLNTVRLISGEIKFWMVTKCEYETLEKVIY